MEPSDVITQTVEGLTAEIDRLLGIMNPIAEQMDKSSLVYHDTYLHISNLVMAKTVLSERGIDYAPKAMRLIQNARTYSRALQWNPDSGLLKWALDNMTFVIPDPHPDSEYDFCRICGMPEWDHKPDCAGTQWERKTKIALKGEQWTTLNQSPPSSTTSDTMLIKSTTIYNRQNN